MRSCPSSDTQIIVSAHEKLDFSKSNFIFNRQDWNPGSEHSHYCGVYHLDPACRPDRGTELYFFNNNKSFNIISAMDKNIYGNFWHIYLSEVNDFVVLRWVGIGYIGWEIVSVSRGVKVHSLNSTGLLMHMFCTVRGLPIGCEPNANPEGVRDFLATIDINQKSPTYNTIVNYSWATDSGFPDPGIEYHHGELASVNDQLVVIAGSLLWNTEETPFGGTNIDMHYAFPEKHPNKTATASAVNVSRAKGCAIHTIHQNPYTGDLLCSYLGTPNTGTPSDGPGGFLNVALKPLFPNCAQGVPVENAYVIGTDPKEIGPSTIEGIYDDWNYDFNINHCTFTLVSTSWGPPSSFDPGFDLNKPYGRAIRIYKMKNNTLDFVTRFVCNPPPQLGGPEDGEGVVPLEVRRVHHPEVEVYFVGVALPGAINLVWKNEKGKWKKKTIISPETVAQDTRFLNNRDGSSIPGGCPVFEQFGLPLPLVTDITLSQDDKFLYVSTWLGGALLQYDVSDPWNPKFVDGMGNLGGVRTINPTVNEWNANSQLGFSGGPQMLRLSPDSRRLFITNSLFSSWDDEFYPEGPGSIKTNGGNVICLDTGVKRGVKVAKVTLDTSFGISMHNLQATLPTGEVGTFRSRCHECHIKGVVH
jgi:selenium-binding protein 1